MTESGKGILAMIMACVVWGLSPIYYKLLSHVPALEILAHRTLWSLATFAVVLAVQGRLGHLRGALSQGGNVAIVMLAALLISVNWFVFILSIQIDKAVEASLGYYIFPLVAVLIGWGAFGEKLGRIQWLAVALVMSAVAVLTVGLGVAPWIALILASTFGLYGMLKKRLDIGPVVSVTCEVLLLAPVAFAVLVHRGGAGAFGANLTDSLLLACAGILTAGPLILFSYATKRTAMATIGLVQYLNPTLQFLCAVMIFGEPFGQWHMIAFAMIWAALVIYTAAGWRQERALRRARVKSEAEAQVVMNPANEASANP